LSKPIEASKYTTIFPPESHWKTENLANSIINETNDYCKKLPWKNSIPFANGINIDE
jgi:hypothetical protein